MKHLTELKSEQLLAFLEERLPESEQAECLKHYRTCSACRRFVDESPLNGELDEKAKKASEELAKTLKPLSKEEVIDALVKNP